MSFDGHHSSNLVRAMLLCAGVLLLACAVLYNQFLLPLFLGRLSFAVETGAKIRSIQVYFLSAGLIFVAISECVRRISWLDSVTRREIVARALLSFLAIFLPIALLELSLRPFASFPDPKTTIYVKDPELGWRLKPNSEDVWSGQKVQINSKGLRGPELEYAKPAHVLRVLYLGDSVTFGDELPSYEQSFPYLTKAILERRLTHSVETINSGVSGYTPWQEDIYLKREGIKFSPDLVVVGFVLNDVTEKFELTRFGGSGEGWQISHTYSSYFEQLADRSSIAYFARRLGAKLRFGRDVREGAKKKETLDVRSLVDNPDRADVRRAWEITLEELDGISDFCRERRIPAILVAFPFRFQFDEVNTTATPQKILNQYAEKKGIPMLDLLPILAERMKQEGLRPEDYFFDSNHFTVHGNQVVAEFIGDFIEKQGVLSHQQE